MVDFGDARSLSPAA